MDLGTIWFILWGVLCCPVILLNLCETTTSICTLHVIASFVEDGVKPSTKLANMWVVCSVITYSTLKGVMHSILCPFWPNTPSCCTN